MRRTPFPASPCDVVALSVPEGTCELDSNGSVSLDTVCRRFLEDTRQSRGLVHPIPVADGLVRAHGRGPVAAIGAVARSPRL
jgi:hypothetical protein